MSEGGLNRAFRRKSIIRKSDEDDGSSPIAPQGGVRKMSVYGKRSAPRANTNEDSDDEFGADEVLFGEVDKVLDPFTLPKPDFGEDVFRSSTSTAELTRLPPIVRASQSDRQDSFLAKIEQCCIVFDFTEQAAPENFATFATSKQVKKNALNELINYVANNKEVLNNVTFPAVVAMVGKNLFRTFTTPSDPKAAPYDPEDDEPILEPAWSHLHLVYTFFLRCLEAKSVKIDMFSRFIDTKWVHKFMNLVGSCDPRERDLAKACVHRMYGRFMPVRAIIRAYMQVVFTRHSNSLFYEAFNGISEYLEFYGCIVSGFVSPLKAEHQQMLLKCLMPLHRKKQLPTYHKQLVHIVAQFLTKETSLGPPVLAYLYRYWPKGNSQKQVLFLNEMQSFAQALGTTFPPLLVDYCKKIAFCCESVHFMVAERALAFFHLQNFVSLITTHAEDVFPILVPAIFRNSKRHWSGAIHDHNEHAIEVLNGVDADLYMQYSGIPVAAADKDHELDRIPIEDKWEKIVALAKQNPLSNEIGIAEVIVPGYTPDIFMKGETTSPKRQDRQYRRASVVRLEPLRNPADVEAAQKIEQADREIEDDDDEAGGLPPVRPKIGMVRKKSTLQIRKPKNKEEDDSSEIENGHVELTNIPPTPNGSSDDGGDTNYANTHEPPPPIEQLDPNPEEWIPLAVGKPATEGCWMSKRSSGMFKRSRRRWFVIDSENKRVSYYVKKSSANSNDLPKGFIMFSDILELGTDKRLLFIITSSRRYALTSDTAIITDQWARALGEVLQKHDAEERTFAEDEEELENVPQNYQENGSDEIEMRSEPRKSSTDGYYGFESPITSPSPSSENGDDEEKSMSGLKRSLSVDSNEDGRLADVVEKKNWFAGKLSKDECNAAVTKANDGDFLVREFKAGGKYVVCVNDGGTPANYTIKQDPAHDNKYKYGSEFRDDIEGIVDLMRVQPPSNKSGKRLWLMEAAPYEKTKRKSPSKTVKKSQKPAADAKEEANGGGGGISRDRKGSVYGFGSDDSDSELEA